jgi:hypothetical protein
VLAQSKPGGEPPGLFRLEGGFFGIPLDIAVLYCIGWWVRRT